MRATDAAVRKEKVVAVSMAMHKVTRREEVTATPLAVYTVRRKAQALPSTRLVMVISKGEVVEGAATLAVPQALWEARHGTRGHVWLPHNSMRFHGTKSDGRILQGGDHVCPPCVLHAFNSVVSKPPSISASCLMLLKSRG